MSKQFFDTIRHDPFPGRLTKSQVRGIASILDEFAYRKLTDKRWLAYMLATAFHETGRRMVPVREGFASNDAEAIAHVTKLYDQGRIKTNYALRHPKTGRSYYGRGPVQLTWYDNYLAMTEELGIDLVNNPDLALDPKVGAEILIVGSVKGMFTGRKLPDYFSLAGSFPIGARSIINGDGPAVAKKVADYFQAFNKALAHWDPTTKVTVPAPPQEEPPVLDHDLKRQIAEMVEDLKALSGAKDVSLIYD